MMNYKFGICSALFVLLTACGGRQTSPSQTVNDTLQLRYAQLLTIVRHQDYTEATVKNPWKQGATLHRYLLVPANQQLPEGLPQGTVVRTPLTHSLVFTTVHCAMLLSLQQENSIAGVADLKYIKLPWIQQQVRQGRLADVGDGLNPAVEKIIDIQPDAILLSPFENSGGYGRLDDIGIPLVECAEYMEHTPLGRAEWIRFYGLLFGCEQRADSLFAAVDSSYQALKSMVPLLSPQLRGRPLPQSGDGNRRQRSKVLVDKVTGSVWYVPGGRSTIGQMLADAGANYPWATNDNSGSVPLPFEAVLEKAQDADIWLFRYSADHDITYQELLGEHHGYNQFKAFKNRRAFGCNVELSPFYEESPFRPDWLLADFIHILHPEIDSLPPLRYYKRVLP